MAPCRSPTVEIVSVGLRSPSIQNRNGALNALEAWGSDHWHDDHRQHLRALAANDPDDRVRTRASELLASGSKS